MSRDSGHPGDLQLLQYADGELPPRRARRVRRHLETCWQCRTELEELEKTVGQCVRYRRNVLDPCLPSPPAPWMDIHAAFSRLDAVPGRASFLGAWLQSLRPASRYLVPAAATALVVCAVYFGWRETPSVQAAELLRKSAAAEQSRPASPRRIRIRTRSRTLTRIAGEHAAADRKGAASEAEATLEPLFRAARYDWEDPLSARAYLSWRGQLPHKQDEVSAAANRDWIVRTSTGDSELTAASLTLRRSDLHPVEGRFEFRNSEWVEMTELPNEMPAPPEVAATLPGPPAPPPPAAAPSHTVIRLAPAPGAPLELQVVAALHQVGADLGDPVEVTRTPDGIVVSGIGVASGRQQQIRAALDPLPHVTVRFSEPEAVPETAAPPDSIDAAPTAASRQFQASLERAVGGRAETERFTSQLLDLNEAAMSRAYALRRLAQRFPAEVEAALGAEDRRLLLRLAGEHAAALTQSESAIEQALIPVLSSLGGTASASPSPATGDRVWQHATEDLFQSARRVETLLGSMLDVSQRNGSNLDLPSRLLTALAQLRAGLEQYRRLLAEDPGGVGK